MASAQKLREGLFFISSGAVNSAAANGQVAVTSLPDVFEFCQLNHNRNGEQVVLELSFVLSKSISPTKLETISVLATNDGLIHKMNLRETKWTTSFNNPLHANYVRCGYRTTTAFDILIDLIPNFAFSLTKGVKNVLDHILNLWETKTLSDITFRCKSKDIEAHTLIVASGSPVFAAMFSNDFRENRKKVVVITDITPCTLSRLLRFMYVGDASLESGVSEADITELLIAADKYNVNTLKEDCARHLTRNLKVENAARFLVLAHLHNSSVLLESTFEFMSKNAKAVCSRKDWMDIIKNYPELCFQATQLMFGL